MEQEKTLHTFLESEKKEFENGIYQDEESVFGVHTKLGNISPADWLSAHDQRLLAQVREMIEGKRYSLKKVDWGDGIITDENAQNYTMSLSQTIGYNQALSDLLSILTDTK